MSDTPDDPVDLSSEDSFPASDPPSWTGTTVDAHIARPAGGIMATISERAARHWWMFAFRGCVAILFAILAVSWPLATLYALVLLFAAWCVIDAVFAELLAIRGAREGGHWVWQTLHALIGLTAGVVAVVWPGLTLLLFALLIAAWGLASGIATIVSAFRLHIDHGRGWMIAGGLIAIALGIAILIRPEIGLYTLLWFVALSALLSGVMQLSLARRLHERLKSG